MYDKWDRVGNFTLLLFAPKQEVETALDCDFDSSELQLEALEGTVAMGEAIFINNGVLDITTRVAGFPSWIQLEAPIVESQLIHLAPGEEMRLPFIASTESLPVGVTSSLLTVSVQDDDYPDCFYSEIFSATITIDVQEEENLHQLGHFRAFGFIISVLVMMASLACALWVAKNARKAIVNAAQPFFLHVLCFGTFIMGASILPLSIDDSLASSKGCSVACMMFPWMLALGFSITFSAVFTKVWRVSKLFQAAGNLQRVKISPQDVMVPFCVIITLKLVLLLTWTLVDPLSWERAHKSSSSSYGTCWSNLSGAQLAILSLLAVVNYSALVLANVQAYHARNIADEFSESKYIFLAMFGVLQVSMIGLPVMFLVLESPPALFFVQSTLVFAIAMSILLWIFVPKIRNVMRYQDVDSRRNITLATRCVVREPRRDRSTEFRSDLPS
ncbi:acid type B receptor subunit 2 [Seminavis robusta]|uniref:Acid type B receptor subunit 2 n=1 Tax=Seminavis robusta TaxID=568900 RepID=A0A9N8ER75_9STRA|nr:acid type B receptor subunit 2 [Seminavis robusta]|eukprot:Sro1387_g268400.1 acid type B receptor subunit 2 (444) ;mRNA; r:27042-28448